MKIFEKGSIGTMQLKNRLVVPAMVTNYTDESGAATERFIAYHEAKAKGGWGLIITENYKVAEDGTKYKVLPSLHSDSLIESHKRLTDRVHQAGGKIVAQLSHAGRVANVAVTGVPSIAPSAIQYKDLSEPVKVMTKTDIKEMVEKYAEAALRAKKAGFDGVELHGGHGYLINQFISPFSNKRIDEYGGTLYGRMRFAMEIVKAVREKVGNEYPLLYRMSTVEYVKGGITIEESKAIACMLEDAGVDAIHCSQGYFGYSGPVTIPPFDEDKGLYVENAAAIKSVVNIPVLAVGRINDPYLAEEVLRSGKADFVSMGRAAWADPELPNKAKNGAYDDILTCIGCVQGCVPKRRCLVNPCTGMESQYNLAPTDEVKHVLVVGGGLAGCYAALAAARRGHQVTIMEQSETLGGQWKLAAVPIGKTEFAAVIAWLERQLKKLNVRIDYNTKVTLEIIEQQKADVTLIATGSVPAVPPIPGYDQSYVVTAHQVLSGEAWVGKHAVIVGGGLVGAETADFLATHGHKVTLIEQLDTIARDSEPSPRNLLLKRLTKGNVSMHTSTTVREIGTKTVTIEYKGETTLVENVDTVILAVGVKTNRILQEELKKYNGNVIYIGDAASVKNGYANIQEGFEAGLNI